MYIKKNFKQALCCLAGPKASGNS